MMVKNTHTNKKWISNLDEDKFGDLAGEEGADGPPQLPLVLDGHLLHVHVLGQPPPLILAQQRLACRM